RAQQVRGGDARLLRLGVDDPLAERGRPLAGALLQQRQLAPAVVGGLGARPPDVVVVRALPRPGGVQRLAPRRHLLLDALDLAPAVALARPACRELLVAHL